MNTKEVYPLGRDDLMIFSILTNPKYTPNWHHELIAKELEDIERKVIHGNNKTVFLLIEVPPRHGKSELSSINFPAWFLGRNPDKEIITSSYSADLSQDFGVKTRDLVQSPEYSAMFNVGLKADSKSKAKWHTDKKGSYTSVGVGGAITGRGANVLLIDDPIKNREEADSEIIRDKIWNWFTSTAFTRLEPNGAVIVIMTRWHMDDLIGRIKEEFTGREDIELKSICFPAISEQIEMSGDTILRHSGEALWKDRYSLEDLHSIRATIGPMDFSALYQQSPILLENQVFKREHFKYFEEEDIKDKELEYTITVDLAISDKEQADDTAIVVVGKERTSPNWYIVEIIDGYLSPLATIDALFSLYEKYRPKKIGIETVAYQKALIFFLEEEMKKREVYLPIQEINSSRNKEVRIKGLQPMFNTGVMLHRRSYLKLESQLLNFPKGKHDDLPDALAMHLEVINKTKRVKSSNPNIKAAVNYLTGKML